MKELFSEYKKRKKKIKKKLREFKKNWEKPNKKIFEELCFCLFTPQTNAFAGDKAVKKLKQKKLLFSDNWKKISKEIPFIRFRNNKAKNLVLAKKQFTKNKKIVLKKILKKQKITENHLITRQWLCKNVKGLGMKEASHFLRNIGFYENIAILDRHILKNMLSLKIIKEIPKTMTQKKYLEIEKKLFLFGKKTGIPIEELDLLLWSKETGKIFK